METNNCLSESDLHDLANVFRIHCIEMTEAPKSGFFSSKFISNSLSLIL